ncbi:hypothetical protein [Ekhidna sp.]|uniref:hypothetical protein n=1 Tax=Ekhidna sp. TaxID=2608089 RepID=UPI003C7AD907
MKKYIAIFSFILFGTIAVAQDFEAPKKGAKIYAKEYTISVDSDNETTFDLWLVRSRFARRATFMEPKLISSSGLTFEVTQDENNKDHYVVTVSAKDVETGQYSTTVSARSTGTQKVVGTTLSFNVTPSKAVASKDGE